MDRILVETVGVGQSELEIARTADQSLVISTDQYEFSVRDEKTSAVYKWTPSVGVKKFLVAGGVQIQEFKVQFKTQQRKSDNEWGSPFVHNKGTCYWVNAIVGN